MKLGALLHSKLFIGIAAGVVAAAAAVTGILLMHHDEAYRVIKVFDKTGTSVVTRLKVGDIDPYIGMNLESGDTVCTFKESTMHVNLDDTKYLLLEPETKIELEASGNSKDNKTKIVLKSGSVLNEITEPLSSGSSYEVSAPKATMAVHGTSFRVSIEKDENGDYITRLYVFHGKVKVTLVDENGNETSQTAIVGEGKCIVIKTVKNEKTGKDAAIDGTSFFVSDGANGKLERVKDGDDPTMDIDYYSIPYDILKEVFTTDKEDEIKLDPEVLRKVIEAMNRRDGTETSGETSPSEQTTEPEQTTSNNEETTAPQGDPDQTSTTTQADPVVTTVPVTTSSANSTTTTTTSSKKDPAPDPDPEPDPEPKNEYSVKFYDFDGTLLSTQAVTDGTAAIEPTSYTKSYVDSATGSTMEFAGWDKQFDSVTGDLIIKPVYKAKAKYSVKFYDYDGTLLSTQTIEEGMPATAPSNVTASYVSSGVHYSFRAWDNSYTNISADLIVKPTYYRSYEVKFFGYDGEQIGETQIVAKNASATEPTEFDKTIDVADGKQSRFAKWDKAFNKITAPTEINAVFDTYYQVTFYDYDDNALSETYVKEKTAATAPTNYTKTYTVDGTHFTFSGWDADFSSITKVTSVHPEYSESYEVKFFGYDGEQIGETQIVAKNASATEPTEFDKTIDVADGKQSRFAKWDKAFNKITAPTEINAVFDTYYQVTFYDYDDNALSETYVKEKTAATAPTNYT
nr:FecR family protein [Ruminococcus sp.]